MDAAIRRAGAERYRPILMTTLTTLAGMLPLALLGGEGVELRRALALAVIGGMTTSAFASLLLVPVLYRFGPSRDAGRMRPAGRIARPDRDARPCWCWGASPWRGCRSTTCRSAASRS